MMRVLLVDDEPLALERLCVAMGTIRDATVVGMAADGVTAIDLIHAERPDLVLLDIQMPALSGMDVARELGSASQRPEIVFVSAFNRFAIEAFAVEAVDYLLKPVSFDRLRLTIDRVRRRLAQRDAEARAAELDLVVAALREGEATTDAGSAYESGIWVPGARGATLVMVDTIDWIEAARDYVLLHTATKSHLLRARMNDLERTLDPRLMVRTHRSHIVRIGAVVGIERPGKGSLRLKLADGATLQVGPSYQTTVARALRLHPDRG